MQSDDPNDLDPIGTMVSKATSPLQVAEILETLAELHETHKFPFSNRDMPSFLRGLSGAVLVFEGGPKGEFVDIARHGEWRVFAEIINMALELD